ncbi:ribonuclease P protein component [Roseimaritima ulvae]|uniref:Ribonuclease P protein component n=1 Tax=Roseimaritima ulvae TaxID=980254 RepID=A0A5B9QKV0_9BACT|nr:ribonuclease P protein component [Roseimaritima ulvae]QEG39708.1 Ribonuclease P protein component [Roseimaritima ulvae]
MVGDYRFPKSVRLTGHEAFGPVIRRGGFAADQILVVHALPHAGSGSRFGVTIPKRTGNAVVRNRWKRHIREAIRHCRSEAAEGYDFVIRPKKDAPLDGRQIRQGLPKLLRRAVKRYAAGK